MRLPRGIVVSLATLALVLPLRVQVAAGAVTPQLPAARTTAKASTPPPAASGAPATATATTKPLNTASLSRFELQRMLNELDEQLKRLRSSVEPADLVLRLFDADTHRIAATQRPAAIQQDSETVRRRFVEYQDEPTNRDLLRRLTVAVDAASIDFSAPTQTLNARVTSPAGARDLLERSPYAAVVPLTQTASLESTLLWEKLHQPPDPRGTPVPLGRSDLTSFLEALSDSSYAAHKTTLLLAYAARVADIQQLTKLDRDELASVTQSAAQVSRDIGARGDEQAKLDARLVYIGVPALSVALIALLLVPLIYKNADLQRAVFSSGLMVELMTVFLLSGTIIILGLDGRIPAEVIGTLLGGLSGYVLGRSINPLVVDRRS